jgi:hypothetical protein
MAASNFATGARRTQGPDTDATSARQSGPATLRKLLLVCGILASLLYISMDVGAAFLFYPGYDYTAQQVSELSAIGAPSRAFWLAVSPAYVGLSVAFGLGVILSSGWRPSLLVAGILIVAFALLGLFWPPMHMRGSATIETDMMHIVFTAAAVLLMLLFMIAGAVALDRAFRIYSAATIVAMLAAGYIVSLQAAAIAAGQPTPWMGLVERVSVYGPMVWAIVFAIALLRGNDPGASANLSHAPAWRGGLHPRG